MLYIQIYASIGLITLLGFCLYIRRIGYAIEDMLVMDFLIMILCFLFFWPIIILSIAETAFTETKKRKEGNMIRKLRSKRGLAHYAMLIAIGSMFTLGIVKTAKDGTLKKNGKKIWCKMTNQGNAHCDALYAPVYGE